MHRTATLSKATDRRYEWPEKMRHLRKPRSPRPETTAKSAASPPPLHLSSGLEPYTEPLDRKKATHLLRRTGFGLTVDDLDALVGFTGQEAVDLLVDAAVNEPMPDPPYWADAFPPPWDAPQEEFDQYVEDNLDWLYAYIETWFGRMKEVGLREKLTLLWHNHFVTEQEVYFFAPMVYRYLHVLRAGAMGNMKDMVYDIGLDPAMMIYLNGDSNTVEEPNENYARELLELFTMGQYDSQGNANYTQFDISEIARALSGWRVDYSNFSTIFYGSADQGIKEIFGQQGTFRYRDVVDLIFEHRSQQMAEFICAKLYKTFVYATPDPAIVAGLAEVFIDNDFEIAPVVRALLRSEHFFDDQVAGARIKGPIELLIGLVNECEVHNLWDESYRFIDWHTSELQQRILQPPNVAGWPGYRSWISTSTLPTRWEIIDFYLWYGLQGENFVSLVPLAEKLAESHDAQDVFALAVALAEHFMAVPLETLGYDPPTTDFNGDLISNPLPDEVQNGPAYVRDLAKIFLNGVPWYEWRYPGNPWMLLNYAFFLTRLPEYQLT